jgi:hypothetical protein
LKFLIELVGSDGRFAFFGTVAPYREQPKKAKDLYL